MQIGGTRILAQKVKAVGHVQLVAIAGVGSHGGDAVIGTDLSNHSGVWIFIHKGTQLFEKR